MDENDLFFSDRGVGVKPDLLPNLEPLKVYEEPAQEGAHLPGTHTH